MLNRGLSIGLSIVLIYTATSPTFALAQTSEDGKAATAVQANEENAKPGLEREETAQFPALQISAKLDRPESGVSALSSPQTIAQTTVQIREADKPRKKGMSKGLKIGLTILFFTACAAAVIAIDSSAGR